MTRIAYSRETLLALNKQNNHQAPANLPEEIRRRPLISTLFNNRVGFCRPMEFPAPEDESLNPGAAAITIR